KSPVRRLSITLPANAPIADIPFEQIAASPDGSRLAYVSGDEAKRLYLYSIDTREARPLPGTEGAMGPFFSPDGQWIGFFTAEQGLKRVPVAGGPPVLVSAERDLRGATWGPHDTIVFAQFAPPMWRVAAAGGRPEALQIATATIPASMRWPMFLPDGNSILFTATDVSSDWENSRLMVESLKNGKTKTVLTGATYGRY